MAKPITPEDLGTLSDYGKKMLHIAEKIADLANELNTLTRQHDTILKNRGKIRGAAIRLYGTPKGYSNALVTIAGEDPDALIDFLLKNLNLSIQKKQKEINAALEEMKDE